MIKFFVMDVDGTLTDGKIYMSPSGELIKAFSIKDGCGIRDILIPKAIIPVIISSRKSEMIDNRCRELGIVNVFQGVSNKLSVLMSICDDLSEVAYIGDDVNDLECMKEVRKNKGIVGCPADSVDEVIAVADFVAPRNGGEGAVRDFIEFIVRNESGERIED